MLSGEGKSVCVCVLLWPLLFLQLLSDTEATPMDLLKAEHISRPKQTVYEMDVFNLTEKVEGYAYFRFLNVIKLKKK